MTERLDTLLDRLLADLCERLAGCPDYRLLVQFDELSPVGLDGLAVLCESGLLVAAEPAKSVVCDGCDRGCVMEVQFAAGDRATATRGFVVCDQRDDIGRVPVSAESLRRWQFSLERAADLVATTLKTDREPQLEVSARTWDLGTFRHSRNDIEVRLVAGETNGAPFDGLTVTLSGPPSRNASRVIPLTSLLRFRDRQPTLNQAALRRALNAIYSDPRVAWEIKYESGDIILINHVTGKPKTIASPNFNSTNDNAFQVLYAKAGEKFTLRELQIEAREPTIADLHKMVENLNFRGAVKKAFFRVSSKAICFDRTATIGRLATLGIDPKADF